MHLYSPNSPFADTAWQGYFLGVMIVVLIVIISRSFRKEEPAVKASYEFLPNYIIPTMGVVLVILILSRPMWRYNADKFDVLLSLINATLFSIMTWRSTTAHLKITDAGFHWSEGMSQVKTEEITSIEIESELIYVHTTKYLKHLTLKKKRLKKASWQELIGSVKQFAEEHIQIEVQEKSKTDLAGT